MDDLTRTPDPQNPIDQVGRGKITMLKILGMEIPLPPWAVSVLAVVAIVAVAVMFAFALKHYRDGQVANNKIADQEKKLNLYKEHLKRWEENLQLKDAEYEEVSHHRLEPSKDMVFTNPDLSIQLYYSDGCVWITRKMPEGSISKWFPGASKYSQPPTAKSEDGVIGTSLPPELRIHPSKNSPAPEALARIIALSPASFSRGDQMTLAQSGGSCKGQCQNPHSGEFRSWEGERQGCWIQVWRKWPDGCTHYQWFNSCNSSWDSDQRGQPRVYWTCCIH